MEETWQQRMEAEYDYKRLDSLFWESWELGQDELRAYRSLQKIQGEQQMLDELRKRVERWPPPPFKMPHDDCMIIW